MGRNLRNRDKLFEDHKKNNSNPHTQLLSVHPGTQTFKTDIVPLTTGVVMELVLHVLVQSCGMSFIHASPGEVVAAEVVAEAEAAGRVGFNCACL